MFLHVVVCLWWRGPVYLGADSVGRTFPVEHSVWKTTQSAALFMSEAYWRWWRSATLNNHCQGILFLLPSAVTTRAPLLDIFFMLSSLESSVSVRSLSVWWMCGWICYVMLCYYLSRDVLQYFACMDYALYSLICFLFCMCSYAECTTCTIFILNKWWIVPANAVHMHELVMHQVKPVSYLMIKSDTVLHSVPGLRMTEFPTAMTIRFSVSFHDDVGVEFYATSSRVRFRLHKYNLASSREVDF